MDRPVALEVRSLSRTFGRRSAVEALDLTDYEGDVYGFLGPNGAGKTTAIRCILGLLRANQGSVTMLGHADRAVALQQVGAIVETPCFHTWLSGRDNLKLAGWYAGLSGAKLEAEIGRVLERVGLTERARDAAGAYSLGMRQRLGIARALLGGPKLLFLDEPTNGLDPAGMREVRELIRSLALHDRITVFMSSHMLAEVQATCNRVGILQAGRLRAEGSVQDLLRDTRTADIVLELAAADAQALAAACAALPDVTVEGPGSAGRLRIRTTREAAQLNRALLDAGVTLSALVPQDRNLEDVFLEVTR